MDSGSGEKLYVAKCSSMATIPRRMTSWAAGLDLYSAGYYDIPPYSQKTVNTALKIKIPGGYYGRIAPRSSLALQNIHVLGGVIDSDYCGIIKVILMNYSNKEYKVELENRIGQLIIQKICLPEIIVLNETEFKNQFEDNGTKEKLLNVRGNMGFGSTGK